MHAKCCNILFYVSVSISLSIATIYSLDVVNLLKLSKSFIWAYNLSHSRNTIIVWLYLNFLTLQSLNYDCKQLQSKQTGLNHGYFTRLNENMWNLLCDSFFLINLVYVKSVQIQNPICLPMSVCLMFCISHLQCKMMWEEINK